MLVRSGYQVAHYARKTPSEVRYRHDIGQGPIGHTGQYRLYARRRNVWQRDNLE
jgi:hypothetical protein